MADPLVDRLAGVYAAVLTPLDADLSPDFGEMALHCRWLLANGCDGLAILGTTGEANSFSVAERIAILDHLIEAGIPAALLLPGTGCCALADSVELTRQALARGVAGVLMLPPFYYKNVSEDGLLGAYSEIIERVGNSALRIYLYHFPQMSAVPLSLSLIERLLARYPTTVVGIKDSSGDLANAAAIVDAFPGFAVLSGADDLLLPVLKAGGAGCITGCANVASALAAKVMQAWRANDSEAAERVQARLSAVRKTIATYPLTAALKEVLADATGRAGWRRLRPPLMPLARSEATALASALDRLGFAPPPLP